MVRALHEHTLTCSCLLSRDISGGQEKRAITVVDETMDISASASDMNTSTSTGTNATTTTNATGSSGGSSAPSSDGLEKTYDARSLMARSLSMGRL